MLEEKQLRVFDFIHEHFFSRVFTRQDYGTRLCNYNKTTFRVYKDEAFFFLSRISHHERAPLSVKRLCSSSQT